MNAWMNEYVMMNIALFYQVQIMASQTYVNTIHPVDEPRWAKKLYHGLSAECSDSRSGGEGKLYHRVHGLGMCLETGTELIGVSNATMLTGFYDWIPVKGIAWKTIAAKRVFGEMCKHGFDRTYGTSYGRIMERLQEERLDAMERRSNNDSDSGSGSDRDSSSTSNSSSSTSSNIGSGSCSDSGGSSGSGSSRSNSSSSDSSSGCGTSSSSSSSQCSGSGSSSSIRSSPVAPDDAARSQANSRYQNTI
jgi:hypothetical protein